MLIGIADKVRARTGANAVPDASIVARSRDPISNVGNAEWRSGLDLGNSRILPSTQQGMRQARPLKEGEVVNITEGEDVPLVKVGTGPVGRQIVGINKAAIAAGRSIVDGVAVGVRRTHSEGTNGLSSGKLKAVVSGGSRILLPTDG